jgi:hypothetical protein
MLILFFVMSVGAYGFNLKRFSHELDHDRQTRTASINHDHAPRLDAKSNPAAEPSNDAEHELLHALSHCELFPNSAVSHLAEPPARTAIVLPSALTLLPAELEPPFRPPRSASLV